MSTSLGRRSFVAFAAAFTILLGLLPVSAEAAQRSSDVIVQALPGKMAEARKAVNAVGGTVTTDLSLINGFEAKLPASASAGLEGRSGIRFVTPNAPVHLNGSFSAAKAPANSVYNQEINSDEVRSTGVDGSGVTVALVDTGVANVGDISGSIVPVRTPFGGTKECVDFSGENTCNDSYGHGTFIAGLIAGSGNASDGKYTGVAPGAKILSVKIGGRDGSADVGKILSAIQWVVQHKDAYGVKVMNLSLGTDSTQSYKLDPLNFAVESAWNSGINVVVSAGNRGPDARTISKPADDPLVITAGAVDDMQTAQTSDDLLPNFTSRGPTPSDGLTKPDLVAPGAHLVSLVSPGSAVEKLYPSDLGTTYRKGSGTSQSAGVVSGSIALLLAAHPELTPNQVKYALTHSATKVASDDPDAVGSGLIDVGKATLNTPRGESNLGVAQGTGTGSLKDSEGTIGVVANTGGAVVGLVTGVLGSTGADGSDPSGGSWYGTSWYGGRWSGGSWYGGSWYGIPNGGSWYGGSWYGGSWYGVWD